MKYMNVGPSLAAKWLGTSRINRKIVKSAVIAYSVFMKRKEWERDASPISFMGHGANKVLIDGHHRLHAVILSGMTVEFKVQYDVSQEAREVQDGGLTRSLSDRLTMFRPGTINVNQRCGYLRLCVQLLSPVVRVRALSDYDLWMRPKIFGDGVEWAVNTFHSCGSRFRRASVAGAFAFAYKASPKELTAMGEAFVKGAELRLGDPMYTLRKFLETGADGKDSKSRLIISRKVLTCISARLQGQTLHKIHATFGVVKDFSSEYDIPEVRELLAPWSAGFAPSSPKAVAMLKLASG